MTSFRQFEANRRHALRSTDPKLRFTQPRALGRKVSDEFVTLLCHRELHGAGDEHAWWKQVGIDPVSQPPGSLAKNFRHQEKCRHSRRLAAIGRVSGE
jgi:hypothetical protein